MKEMLLNKYTILLIILILGTAYIGGQDAKKTADKQISDSQTYINKTIK